MIINKNVPYTTYKNHYKWGFNNVPFSFRDSLDDEYFVKYGKLSRRPMSWRDECIETAKLIYDEANGDPIRILFSGGMDSNVITESFRLAGVPFSIVTIIFGDNWNWHDIKFAVDWCKKHNIPQQMIQCDVMKFWESGEFLDFGYPVQARSPQYCVHLWGMDQVDGFLVIGLGEGELYRKKQKDVLCYEPDGEYCRVWERHLIVRNRNGAGSFFKYTPELKASQFLTDEFINWANYPDKWKHIKNHKNNHYRVHFPQLKARPTISSRFGDNYTDYNGFDCLPQKAIDAEKKARDELLKHFQDYNQIIETEYNTLMKKLLTDELFEEFIAKRTNGLLL